VPTFRLIVQFLLDPVGVARIRVELEKDADLRIAR
jgi:hypothetical protein